MTPAQYGELLDDIANAYAQSHLATARPGWHYGVCATRITPGRPLIVGINWGVGATPPPNPPTHQSFPTETLGEQFDKPGEMGSIANLKPFLERHVPGWRDGGQANLYFFRTRRANELDDHDRSLCDPIFKRLLTIAAPSVVIALSAVVRNWFEAYPGFLADVRTTEIVLNARGQHFKLLRGSYAIGGQRGRFAAVPHPATPATVFARETAWAFGFA